MAIGLVVAWCFAYWMNAPGWLLWTVGVLTALAVWNTYER